MISYNPKEWLSFIFSANRNDTIRKLVPFLFLISAYTAGIVYLETQFLRFSEHSGFRHIGITHNLLGFVLSMLLVFRTNSAYDRWWEGRKLWGSLVNNSRNLALKLNALLGKDDQKERMFFSKTIPMYAQVLKDHLRSEKTRLELDQDQHPELISIETSSHQPNHLMAILLERLIELKRQKKISEEELLFMNQELQSFTEICGACERIKNTPIPYSYSVFVKKFIFIYVITLPFGFSFQLGFWMIPVVAFIFFVLGSLELIAEEIEDPFGGDENDIPTERIAEGIKKSVNEILR